MTVLSCTVKSCIVNLLTALCILTMLGIHKLVGLVGYDPTTGVLHRLHPMSSRYDYEHIHK